MLEYLVSVATLAAITAILVLGVNVRWGLAGELDLGFYLFPAVGSYVYAVLTLPSSDTEPGVHYILGLGQPFVVGFVGAGVATALLSLAIGVVALRRLRATYFAVVTVATTIIAYTFISQYTPLFNGYNGVYGVGQPFADTFGLTGENYLEFFLGLCVLILIAVYVVLEMIRRSPFGRAVKAVREDEVASSAFGRSPFKLRLKAYVLGGVVGGLGGALLVIYVSAFNPSAWSTGETFLLYSALLVGGTANNLGATVGAVLALITFPQLLLLLPTFGTNGDSLPAIENIVFGLLIILTLYFRPSGLLPELRTMNGQFRTRGRWNRRPRPTSSSESEADNVVSST